MPKTPPGAITIINEQGRPEVFYEPQDHPRNNQVAFHASNAANLLVLGTRGTGKSKQLRMDAIARCLMFPGFKALILRRSIPDMRKTHIHFLELEMKKLGGVYLHTTMQAKFPNGSIIQLSHCEKMVDIVDFLGSEWGFVGFDELSTFPLDMFLQICAAARAADDAPYVAVVRAASNTLGIGSAWMKQWFVDKNVNFAEYPDYNPADYEVMYAWLDANKYINQVEYRKRLKNLPDHVRRSWLDLEFIIEGAYFTEFQKQQVGKDGKKVPWHCIHSLPTYQNKWLTDISWIRIYRSIDWGYHPDPAVCHWHLILPNNRKITFKEETWKRTLAPNVAKDIARMSEGMRIVATYADPTMFIKSGESPFSIGELFEQNGVPLTPSQNDRELFGYAVHQMLATIIEDNGKEYPQWQILEEACPELVRTLPLLQMDPKDPRKIADGPDHWVVSCAYFAMGDVVPSRDPVVSTIPRWMQPKPRPRYRM